MSLLRKLSRSHSQPVTTSLTRLYHYLRQSGESRVRVHLRLDPDGHGTLIVNANRILHLNPTAARMAQLLLEGRSREEIAHLFRTEYRISRKQLLADLDAFALQLEGLLAPEEVCPIHDLGLETVAPFSAHPTAPYRLDLALTYRCNNDCPHCYNVEHWPPGLTATLQGRELPTDDWKRILDRAWELGIPHIVFTGGEPTLRDDLPALIAYAEHNGQITGLNTNGRRLADPKYLEQLVEAGLDHLQITLESCEAEIHDRMVGARAFDQTVRGLKNALRTRLFVMTNTTMLRTNVHTIPATLDFLAELGVPTVGLNALIYAGRGATVGTGLDERELAPLLALARQKTEAHGQRLIWYTPTQYCHFDPVQMELGVKGCTAALYNMCVEPDGGVLPCQSYYQPLGNFLRDDWETIWNHPLAVRLRERKELPAKCHGCPLWFECGGGCPLLFQNVPPVEEGRTSTVHVDVSFPEA